MSSVAAKKLDNLVTTIRTVVARHHSHRRRATQELGISLSTLKRRLRATGP
jgi:transcriptional regulator with PAS, ATPase and Fis domain